MTSTIHSNNENQKGIRRKVPPGYYTRTDVSKMTGISIATLTRWRNKNYVIPERVEQFGQTEVGFYSEAQVNMLLESPPYLKPGRPPKENAT